MPGGQKRFLSDSSEQAALRRQVVAKIALLLDRTEEEVGNAASSAATLLSLGLTSKMGIELKGWVFHELEAELTTFELLKQPLDDVVLAIEGSRRQDLGVHIPNLSPPPVVNTEAPAEPPLNGQA
jgi:hypothetical protein